MMGWNTKVFMKEMDGVKDNILGNIFFFQRCSKWFVAYELSRAYYMYGSLSHFPFVRRNLLGTPMKIKMLLSALHSGTTIRICIINDKSMLTGQKFRHYGVNNQIKTATSLLRQANNESITILFNDGFTIGNIFFFCKGAQNDYYLLSYEWSRAYHMYLGARAVHPLTFFISM